VPSTDWLGGQLALDETGLCSPATTPGPEPGTGEPGAARRRLLLETSWPGVFAAGDVRNGSIKRVASAVGEGAMAARLAHERAQAGEVEPAGRAGVPV
jgi:thioredoxin reductase (NADPH)